MQSALMRLESTSLFSLRLPVNLLSQTERPTEGEKERGRKRYREKIERKSEKKTEFIKGKKREVEGSIIQNMNRA